MDLFPEVKILAIMVIFRFSLNFHDWKNSPSHGGLLDLHPLSHAQLITCMHGLNYEYIAIAIACMHQSHAAIAPCMHACMHALAIYSYI